MMNMFGLLYIAFTACAADLPKSHEDLGLPALIKNYVKGEFAESVSKNKRENVSPATNKAIGFVVDSVAADVESAIGEAKKAQDIWASFSVYKRAKVLEELATTLENSAEVLSKAESLDMGKILASSAGDDLKRQVRNVKFFASSAVQDISQQQSSIIEIDTESQEMDQRPGDDFNSRRTFFNYVTRYPVGIIGIIAHWSRPLHQIIWRLAPALIMGNAVIIKAPSDTPLTAFVLAQIIHEEFVQTHKIPSGLINFVFGSGKNVGAAMASHRAIGAISFVGGPEAASAIQMNAANAGSMKKIKVDVGNNHALVVLPDADLEKLVPVAVTAAFKCDAGQRAHSIGRLILHADIAQTFLLKFIEESRKLRLGNPLDVNSDLGPLVSRYHQERVLDGLKDLIQSGGTFLLGGLDNATHPPDDPELKDGYWFHPTIVGPFTYERNYTGLCPNGCGADDQGDYDYDQGKPWSNELQGPVVKVIIVDDISTAIHAANAGPFGLSASVWSSNIDHAHAVAHALDVGYVWVNNWLARDLAMPFGGWKESGNGQRSGGKWDLDFNSYTKTTAIEFHQNRHELTGKSFS